MAATHPHPLPWGSRSVQWVKSEGAFETSLLQLLAGMPTEQRGVLFTFTSASRAAARTPGTPRHALLNALTSDLFDLDEVPAEDVQRVSGSIDRRMKALQDQYETAAKRLVNRQPGTSYHEIRNEIVNEDPHFAAMEKLLAAHPKLTHSMDIDAEGAPAPLAATGSTSKHAAPKATPAGPPVASGSKGSSQSSSSSSGGSSGQSQASGSSSRATNFTMPSDSDSGIVICPECRESLGDKTADEQNEHLQACLFGDDEIAEAVEGAWMPSCPVCEVVFKEELTGEDREEHLRTCIEGGGATEDAGTEGAGEVDKKGKGKGKMVDSKLEHVASEDMDDECIICFEDFEKGQTLYRLSCYCVFHKACADGWWKTGGAFCPTHSEQTKRPAAAPAASTSVYVAPPLPVYAPPPPPAAVAANQGGAHASGSSSNSTARVRARKSAPAKARLAKSPSYGSGNAVASGSGSNRQHQEAALRKAAATAAAATAQRKARAGERSASLREQAREQAAEIRAMAAANARAAAAAQAVQQAEAIRQQAEQQRLQQQQQQAAYNQQLLQAYNHHQQHHMPPPPHYHPPPPPQGPPAHYGYYQGPAPAQYSYGPYQ